MAKRQKLCTKSEYARRRGVAPSTITRKIQKGLVPVEPDGLIDEDKARAQEERGKHPTMGGRRTLGKAASPSHNGYNGGLHEAHMPEQDEKGLSYAEILRRREYYKAQQERLKYLELVGRLVDAEQVKKEAFETGRTIRDHMLNIPSRLAGQLAAESNQDRIFDILNKEILQALESLPTDEK